jgi:hypothetical protein
MVDLGALNGLGPSRLKKVEDRSQTENLWRVVLS